MAFRVLPVTLALGLLSGCADTIERYNTLHGIGSDLKAEDVELYTGQQQKVLNNLILLSGQDPAKPPINWRAVVDAGINYVDAECERYVDAIFWFNRQNKTTVNQINLVGVAATATLGVLEAAAKELAITALAFGLAGQTVDNIGKGLLYEIDPSGVRTIVERTQAAYRDSIVNSNYTSQPAASNAIQGYLALCQPTTIETEVNEAIRSANFKGSLPADKVLKEDLNNAVPTIRQITTSEPQPVVIYSGTSTGTSLDIEKLLRRTDGSLDEERLRVMKQVCWPKAKVPADTIALDFLRGATFEQQRRIVAACMTAQP